MQSLTEDPSLYLQALKRRLQEKEGIPVQYQRLIFAAPGAADLSAGQLTSSRAGAEDLLVELSSWQVRLIPASVQNEIAEDGPCRTSLSEAAGRELLAQYEKSLRLQPLFYCVYSHIFTSRRPYSSRTTKLSLGLSLRRSSQSLLQKVYRAARLPSSCGCQSTSSPFASIVGSFTLRSKVLLNTLHSSA